jgi:hypothetical protein
MRHERINKKYPFALVPSARNNIEWNYILLPFQNGILCITQNIPTELYSNVAPIILEETHIASEPSRIQEYNL